MGIVDIRSLGYYNIRKSIMFFDKRGNTKIPPPSYKVPHIHPRNYYQTGQVDTKAESTEKASNSQSIEKAGNPQPTGKVCRSQVKEDSLKSHNNDPYPWLDEDDLRRDMMDEEILDKYVDLTNSDLTPDEKGTLMKIIKEHKQAFSLRDEIGKCPDIKIDIDVIDDSPFFVRPFPIHEEDKPVMDKYMAKLVSLGILSKNNTTHTSPVMLVA